MCAFFYVHNYVHTVHQPLPPITLNIHSSAPFGKLYGGTGHTVCSATGGHTGTVHSVVAQWVTTTASNMSAVTETLDRGMRQGTGIGDRERLGRQGERRERGRRRLG